MGQAGQDVLAPAGTGYQLRIPYPARDGPRAAGWAGRRSRSPGLLADGETARCGHHRGCVARAVPGRCRGAGNPLRRLPCLPPDVVLSLGAAMAASAPTGRRFAGKQVGQKPEPCWLPGRGPHLPAPSSRGGEGQSRFLGIGSLLRRLPIPTRNDCLPAGGGRSGSTWPRQLGGEPSRAEANVRLSALERGPWRAWLEPWREAWHLCSSRAAARRARSPPCDRRATHQTRR